MKVEGYLFSFVAVFLAVSDIVYWYTSHDPTGTTAMALSCGLGIIIGSYCLLTARRIEPRPEDLPDAEIADGAGEIGFFSPHSWQPLLCASAAALTTLGFIFGWWLSVIGFAFLIA